jgi:hypothetical protein
MAKTWRCLPTKTCLRRVDDVSLRAGPGRADMEVTLWYLFGSIARATIGGCACGIDKRE